jgi:hypothetical protein
MNPDEVTNHRNPFTTTLAASNWYQVALCWSTNGARGYLDGELQFEFPFRDGYPFWLNPDFANVALGNGYSTSSDRFWKGLLDEVRVCTRPLPPTEIAELYRVEVAAVRNQKLQIEDKLRRSEQAEFENTRKRPVSGLDVGLALYLPFEGDARDHSGNRRQGEPVGVQFTSEGRVGGACRFGGNAYITFGDVLDLSGAVSNLTVCLWVKAPPVTGTSEWPPFPAKSQEQSPFTGWGLYADPLSRALVDLMTAYPMELSAASHETICDGTWHHVGAIYEVAPESLRLMLYVDGEPRDICERAGTHPPTATRSPLTIGRRTPGSARGFIGLLDELRIYDRSLSAKEVAELFRKTRR